MLSKQFLLRILQKSTHILAMWPCQILTSFIFCRILQVNTPSAIELVPFLTHSTNYSWFCAWEILLCVNLTLVKQQEHYTPLWKIKFALYVCTMKKSFFFYCYGIFSLWIYFYLNCKLNIFCHYTTILSVNFTNIPSQFWTKTISIICLILQYIILAKSKKSEWYITTVIIL